MTERDNSQNTGEVKQPTWSPAARCVCGGPLMSPDEKRVGTHFQCHLAVKATEARIERLIEAQIDALYQPCDRAYDMGAYEALRELLTAVQGGGDA